MEANETSPPAQKFKCPSFFLERQLRALWHKILSVSAHRSLGAWRESNRAPRLASDALLLYPKGRGKHSSASLRKCEAQFWSWSAGFSLSLLFAESLNTGFTPKLCLQARHQAPPPETTRRDSLLKGVRPPQVLRPDYCKLAYAAPKSTVTCRERENAL